MFANLSIINDQPRCFILKSTSWSPGHCTVDCLTVVWYWQCADPISLPKIAVPFLSSHLWGIIWIYRGALLLCAIDGCVTCGVVSCLQKTNIFGLHVTKTSLFCFRFWIRWHSVLNRPRQHWWPGYMAETKLSKQKGFKIKNGKQNMVVKSGD